MPISLRYQHRDVDAGNGEDVGSYANGGIFSRILGWCVVACWLVLLIHLDRLAVIVRISSGFVFVVFFETAREGTFYLPM